MKTLTVREAIDAIADLGSHGALGPLDALPITKALGLKPLRFSITKANTDPKGFLHDDLPRGYPIQMMSGCDLAEAVAFKLGWDGGTESIFGRMRRFHLAVEYLRRWAEAPEEAPVGGVAVAPDEDPGEPQ